MPTMTESGPFSKLVDLWTKQIQGAIDHKHEVFGQYANECWDFYDSANDVFDETMDSPFFQMEDKQKVPRPTFKPVINKAAEMEQLFAPMAYHKNPVPIIRPRELTQIDPLAMGGMGMEMFQYLDMETQQRRMEGEIRGKLLETYIKYSADELDLRSNARLALTEALIKGRGLLWFELYQGPGQEQKVAGAFFDSVDNLIIDPDAPQLVDAQWIARRRIMPWWSVEKRFQLPYGSLKKYASKESFNQRARGKLDPHNRNKRKKGDTYDMIEYWEIYSKMGIGDRLSGKLQDVYGDVAEEYSTDFCFLAVCEGCPYFLNLPDEVLDIPEGPELTAEFAARLEWPIPYWGDGGWPFVELDIHPHVTEVWPTPHLKPALGELYWLNWCASFLMQASTVSSRQFIAVAEEAYEEMANALKTGECFDILKFSATNNKSIAELVQFLQHPPISGELINIFNLVSSLFDKRTGLTELAYGQTGTQIRSAQEANIKSEAMNVRPNDIAEKVEHFMKRVHKSIAMAARWHLVPQTDIAPVMGQMHAMLWQQLIYSSDIETVVRELDYTVEAGSARKPNLAREQDQMQQAMQIILPIASGIYTGTGDPTLLNSVLRDWARSQEIDQSRYVIQPPPMMPPTMAPTMAPPAEGGGNEAAAA